MTPAELSAIRDAELADRPARLARSPGWTVGWPTVGPLVDLRQVSRKDFTLLEPVGWKDDPGTADVYWAPDLVAHPEHRDWTTDLASVPFVVWGQIAPFGRQTRSAIVHDYGCLRVRLENPNAVRSAKALSERRIVDTRFRRGLRLDGVPTVRALLMWAGVAVQRIAAHAHVLLAALLVTQLVVCAGLVYWGVPTILSGSTQVHWDWVWNVPGLGLATSLHLAWPWYLALLALLLPWVWNLAGGAGGAVFLVQVVGAVVAPLALANAVLAMTLAAISKVLNWHEPFDFNPTVIFNHLLGSRS